MATYTTLTIINKALVLCGASTVTSLTEDTPNARTLNAVYQTAKEDFLTECRWTFSTTRTTLVTVASSTIAWFHTIDAESIVYSKPSGALRIWEMSDEHAIWREEGDYIISDTNNLGAKWTQDVDIGKFSPFAAKAFIDKLCEDICFHILNSGTKAQAFLEKYQKVSLPDAMSKNSQQGAQQIVVDDFWEASKLSNGGNQARSYG